MKFSRIALLSAATLAVAQPHNHHNHAHRHAARHASPVEGRSPAVVEAAAPVVTKYELNGEVISWDDVEAGLKNGKYVLVGDKISNVIPATPTPTPSTSTTPTPTPTPSSTEAAKFFEKKPSSSKTTPTPTPTPTPSTSAAPSSSANSYGSGSGSGNIEADFPSGTIKCSEFPSAYGAVALDYLGLGGWSGLQHTPSFGLHTDSVISDIVTGIAGGSCKANTFCSYACPAGYQKSQWPKAQGNTGQSIGGLYCNSEGYLELSRPSVKQICIQGVGGVKVKNSMSKSAAICRTDYPGTESETIPLMTHPGGEYDLTCPDGGTYYQWNGARTSAQYYINNAGVSQEDACDWGSAGSNQGNWAPVNVGVGRGSDGVSYLSIFQNAPTNTDGVLNFKIEVKGDVSGACSYSNGKFYQGSTESPTGCTVGVPSGGEAYFEFS